MGSDGIHVAAGQHRILHAAVFDAEHIDRLRDARVRAAEEDLLRLAGALHGDMVFPARSPGVRMLLSASTATT